MLGFSTKVCAAGTHGIDTVSIEASIDKRQFKGDGIDGELMVSEEKARFRKFKNKPTTNLYQNVNKDKLDAMLFYIEDADQETLDFNIEVLKITSKFTFSNFLNSKITVLALSGKILLEQVNSDKISDNNEKNWWTEEWHSCLLVFRMQLNRTMIVSDRTIQVEGLLDMSAINL